MNRERAGFDTDRRGCLKGGGSAAIGLAASGAGLTAAARNLADVQASVRWTPDVIARR